MIIDDGALAKALKREAKDKIKLMAEGGILRLLFGETRVVLDLNGLDEPPRMTLAALVEMLGYIPSACCIEIIKTKEGYAEQELLISAFTAESDMFSVAGEKEPVASIPITFRALLLFQCGDKSVYGAKPGELSICVGPLSVGTGNLICASDNDSWFCTRGYRPEELDKLWCALESTLWNSPKVEVTEEEDDQIEINGDTED
ncbi:MAG: hypothetical protein EOM54_11660 [Clostridia bacterium]|nr:hypothetical protein [Clostridia bacterium]